ncbi:LacI family DNA-binding transcriptional regulator [Levilactobacillus tujiorum]|uniref:LacI family DNA-binding transcriptional regulator n=1 Tax=Levilactobacillus tujiorum TaxID=2912243 RepID=A0ABX1L5U4_9LACO|nr:LacI family DNA-binding transcriptional regulator [Levilactobacillus tujiorum]MCH5464929.1 LacI family DNA-binding transcriptional regulator [Levilactobacillus tujiorum]NLR12458.1 LacI family DNA-binding transcriptional regulator [Lactobacillus sp. HBUAS51387]NLR30435.1 LacI family DNA-binding transcriptional regulator [Levilactobacillus tujiorum]
MLTIRDIAAKAGVSVSTASRALNNNPRISLATRKRIQALATAEGYRPNYNAKNLTSGEANAVGVVFPTSDRNSTDNPFYIDLLRGINTELMKRQYVLSVAISKTADELLENVKAMVAQGKIKRFVLLYVHQADPVAAFLREKHLHFVTIGEPVDGHDDYFVDNDNLEAGIGGASFLLDQLAVKHPVFVESGHNWGYEQQRRQGYERVAAQYNVEPLTCKLNDLEYVQSFIKHHPEIDGIMATDDFNAIEFYRLLREQYVASHFPVVSYNHSLPTGLTDANLHSVNLFPEKMGSATVSLLFSDREETADKQIRIPYEIK